MSEHRPIVLRPSPHDPNLYLMYRHNPPDPPEVWEIDADNVLTVGLDALSIIVKRGWLAKVG